MKCASSRTTRGWIILSGGQLAEGEPGPRGNRSISKFTLAPRRHAALLKVARGPRTVRILAEALERSRPAAPINWIHISKFCLALEDVLRLTMAKLVRNDGCCGGARSTPRVRRVSFRMLRSAVGKG